ELNLTVVTAVGMPPDRVAVNGRAADFRPVAEPVGVFGLDVWRLRAAGVGLDTGGALPKAVRVTVGNADGDGPPADVAVVPKPAPPPPPAPPLTPTHAPDKTPVRPR